MSILSYSGNDMLNDYYSCCEESALHKDIREKWPLFAHKFAIKRCTIDFFALPRKHVSKIDIGNWSFNWTNADEGEAMALLMGISDVGSIPVCDNRLAFLNDGVKRFSSLYESEMTFIADFISTLVWLIPKMQMPIMEVLHFTNFHMLPLFPMPHSSLFHRSISFQENSGFLVSSKTSITKHFIIKYTFNAFHGNQYCQGALGSR